MTTAKRIKKGALLWDQGTDEFIISDVYCKIKVSNHHAFLNNTSYESIQVHSGVFGW